jgi:hypothetical protein
MNFTAPSKRLSLSWTGSRRTDSLGIHSRWVPCLRLPLRSSTPSRSPIPPESSRYLAFGLVGASPPDLVPPPWFNHLDGLLRTQGPGYIAIRCRTRFTAFRADGTPVLPISDPHEQARIGQLAVADVNVFPLKTSDGKPSPASTAAPRSAIHTPRRIPLACSCTASLRPLPSCRYQASPPHCASTTCRRPKPQTLYQHHPAETGHHSNLTSAS